MVTPGWFDTRAIAPRTPLPGDLTGKRCLDVGTFDGFWAFEMERRGASEVHAIDILDPVQWDWPVRSEQATIDAIGERKGRGEGFLLAKEALGSDVIRHELSVYDLDERLGQFDVVYLGSLLIHLKNPVVALERLRSSCREKLVVVDNIDPSLSRFRRAPLARFDGRGRPWWWKFNLPGLVRLIEAGGFEIDAAPQKIRMPAGEGQGRPPTRPSTFLRSNPRGLWLDNVFGDPHAMLSARPA